MAVSVTCSTKRKGELFWRHANGELAENTEYTPATTTNGDGEAENIQRLTIFIPEVNGRTVGDYQCQFHPAEGEKRAPETFSLRMKQCKSFQSCIPLPNMKINLLFCLKFKL